VGLVGIGIHGLQMMNEILIKETVLLNRYLMLNRMTLKEWQDKHMNIIDIEFLDIK